jgi:hypothetical protein
VTPPIRTDSRQPSPPAHANQKSRHHQAHGTARAPKPTSRILGSNRAPISINAARPRLLEILNPPPLNTGSVSKGQITSDRSKGKNQTKNKHTPSIYRTIAPPRPSISIHLGLCIRHAKVVPLLSDQPQASSRRPVRHDFHTKPGRAVVGEEDKGCLPSPAAALLASTHFAHENRQTRNENRQT